MLSPPPFCLNNVIPQHLIIFVEAVKPMVVKIFELNLFVNASYIWGSKMPVSICSFNKNLNICPGFLIPISSISLYDMFILLFFKL
jgi:hypothetical protein